MDRLTKALGNKKFYITDNDKINHDENGYFGDAVDKLANFENAYDSLLESQNEISEEMEKLRNECNTRSFKFKELMAKKITNNNIIALFKAYGL